MHKSFRSKWLFYPAVLIFLLLGGCCKPVIDIPAERSLLIYMAGDNDLSHYLYANIETLKGGFIPQNGNIIIYFDAVDAPPRLFRLVKQGAHVVEELIEEYPQENSADPQVLTRCLLRMRELYPAGDYALILSSHATGWLPYGTYGSTFFRQHTGLPAGVDYPVVKTFAVDGRREMELGELVSAIPYPLSFILFDACLMGGIEVVYALRDVADKIVASPAEILATGFPYDQIMQPMFLPQPDLEEVCNAYYRYYNGQSGLYRSATIALYHTKALPQLATSVKAIFEKNRDQVASFNPNQLQYYCRVTPHLFYDLDDFIKSIADPADHESFSEALKKVVVYKFATPSFLEIPIDRYGGISTYIPVGTQTVLRAAYKETEWNRAVGLLE